MLLINDDDDDETSIKSGGLDSSLCKYFFISVHGSFLNMWRIEVNLKCGLWRYFMCDPMHGLFTPIQKLSSPGSGVTPDTKGSSSPQPALSPRYSASHRQQHNTVCPTITVTSCYCNVSDSPHRHADRSVVFARWCQCAPRLLEIPWVHISLIPKWRLDQFSRLCKVHDCVGQTNHAVWWHL